MALKEWKVGDFLRGRSEKVTLRFNPKDLVRLRCHCDYDPALRGKDDNEVMIPRKVEMRNEDGSWGPYPSVTWLDGVGNEEVLVTRALVKKTNEKGLSIMESTQGVPDGTLMCAAEEAGIYTETLDG